MPVARVYPKSQWEALARTLDALPEKPEAERGLSVRDAMKDIRGRIRTAQTKGYTLEQIAEQARQAGIDITAGTIRYALRSEGKRNSTGKGNSAGNTARPVTKAPAPVTVTTLPRAHGAAQGGASRVNNPRPDGHTGGRTEGRTEGRNEARPHGGKAEVKPQPVPVQGSLAFAIKPDTDDL
ncbi:hypothetical protein PQQ96_11855 [Paraburkholderia sediminicola]|uniref:hypothetical protein n=1 Tax=Paraburkholderia sediminicola TaxID=458836 RepID=UPI0038BC70B2